LYPKMNQMNGTKNLSYFDSRYLSQDMEAMANSSATSSPYYFPYSRSMSTISTPFGPTVGYGRVESGNPSMTARNNTIFSPFESQSSTSVETPLGAIPQNWEKKCDFECNENKIEFKILVEYLENLRQNNQTFQTNILKELKQMREVMADLKKSIQEMPIKFADALTQCLDSVNGRSDGLSVDSEPEIVDLLDKIEIINDCKEDNTFVDFADEFSKETKADEKSSSVVDKFVFEYNPYIDLDKWLKKD